MAEVRALIVDDEPDARAGIRKLLAHDADVEVVGEAGSGPAAVRAIIELQPDLLFLDIQMPEMNGFDVLLAAGAKTVPAVVFVTAYDQFAVRAFEVQALDYLLKPFDNERFGLVIDRAKRHLRKTRDSDLASRLEAVLESYEQRGPAAPPTKAQPPEQRGRSDGPHIVTSPHAGRSEWVTRIIVRTGGRVFFQPVDEIEWIEAADYYARLHVGEKTHLVRETLTALENQLDPDRFLRVHRSAIVNVSNVQSLRPDWRNRHELILKSGAVVPLSRGRKAAVESLLRRAR